jgi:RND family efflux transporter MFP subunit
MKSTLPLQLLALAGIAFLTACGKPHATTPARDLPPVSVSTITVAPEAITATEDAVGTVQPKLRAAIAAKVSGTIDAMKVVPGQTVAAGELLVQLDAREIQARFDQARAMREQADNDVTRFKKLRETAVISAKEYDDAVTRQLGARAAETEAKTMLDYVKITAPFAGVITRKLADVGDLAQPGRPLLEMENPRDLRIEADIPEALVAGLKLGDKLRIRVAAAKADLEGTVSEISPSAQTLSRTFLVKLDLPMQDGLRSGQFGRVAVPVTQRDVIAVPASAVTQRGQLEFLHVAANGRAQLRLVKTGRRLGDRVEIISGLDAGEAVILPAEPPLQDGQPVVVKP